MGGNDDEKDKSEKKINEKEKVKIIIDMLRVLNGKRNHRLYREDAKIYNIGSCQYYVLQLIYLLYLPASVKV